MNTRRLIAMLLTFIFLVGCAAPLRTSVAPFYSPELLPNAQTVWQLVIAADVLDTPEKSERVFGPDLAAADVLPVQVIVKNRGSQEYEIDAAQIYGVFSREYYPAFNLAQAAQRIRESSIGTTVAAQATLGALAGAAAGAAIGAAAGGAVGDAGRGQHLVQPLEVQSARLLARLSALPTPIPSGLGTNLPSKTSAIGLCSQEISSRDFSTSSTRPILLSASKS